MTGLILEFYDRSGWHEAPSPTRPVCVKRIDREAIHRNDAVSGYPTVFPRRAVRRHMDDVEARWGSCEPEAASILQHGKAVSGGGRAEPYKPGSHIKYGVELTN